jgi:uncharacterized membrane protein required for colicin V production
MFWDGVIGLMALILGINGARRGLLRCWPGIIAMVIAAICLQRFYINLAAFVTSHLHTSPRDSVAIAYVLGFFSVEALLELLLQLLIRKGEAGAPVLLDQLGGAAYGLLKASIFVILPTMVLSVDINVPAPPKDATGMIVPFEDGTKDSFLLPLYGRVAQALMPTIGSYVTSTDPPSFQPDFHTIKEKQGEE